MSAAPHAGALALRVAQAAAHLAAGGLVAFPTETVWGLGVDARSAAAVAALRRFKGRSDTKPLSVLVADAAALAGLIGDTAPEALRLAERFWPGPLTLVVPAGPAAARLAPGVARPDGALGVRCSPHPVARALARAVADAGVGPVTATSLNPSGRPPARTRAEAAALCAAPPAGPADGEAPDGPPGSAPPRLVAGDDAGGEAPSSVLDMTGESPILLREGPIAAAALRRAGVRLRPTDPPARRAP